MPTRTVLVRADWKCWPTWTVGESGSVDNPAPAALGLSRGLSTELLAWADAYDAIFNEDYPPDTAFPSPEAERAWVERGCVLAERVAEELGAGAEVRYEHAFDGS